MPPFASVSSDLPSPYAPRYLYRYHLEGTLHSERAANAREECKKIKNISKTASQVSCHHAARTFIPVLTTCDCVPWLS